MTKLIEMSMHSNGIYEIIFHATNRAAVDEYMATLEEILVQKIENEETVRVMIDMTQVNTLPPIAYVTEKGRQIVRDHFADRDKVHIRSAFIADRAMQITLSIAQSLMNLLPIDATIEVFAPEERQQAEDWLNDNTE